MQHINRNTFYILDLYLQPFEHEFIASLQIFSPTSIQRLDYKRLLTWNPNPCLSFHVAVVFMSCAYLGLGSISGGLVPFFCTSRCHWEEGGGFQFAESTGKLDTGSGSLCNRVFSIGGRDDGPHPWGEHQSRCRESIYETLCLFSTTTFDF